MKSKKLNILRLSIEFVLVFSIGAILGLLLTSIGVPPFWDNGSLNPFAWVAITCFALLLACGDWDYPKEEE